MNVQASLGPNRIVCLSASSADIVYRLGAWDKVVGMSGFTRLPSDARPKPKVGGFTTIDLEKVIELKPDLVISYSHLQAGISEQLVAAGINVLALNQRSIQDILDTIALLGSLVGRGDQAQELAANMAMELEGVARAASGLSYHPRVFFEEWGDPVISASQWIAESVELAGGVDIFPELRTVIKGKSRSVASSDVLARDPEIIVASWCSRKVDLESIYRRDGWGQTTAVKNRRVYWMRSRDILEAGPSFVTGVKELHRIIAEPAGRR